MHQRLYGLAAFRFYRREHAGFRADSWLLAAGERLNIANPLAQILSVAMLFEYFDLKEEGALIREAVDASLDANVRTPEIQVEGGAKYGTKEVGSWVVNYITEK